MKSNNNKSPNKGTTKKKNDNKPPSIFDISLTFLENTPIFNNNIISPIPFPHNDLEKTVDELINEIYRDFDDILNDTYIKQRILDQSYNDLLLTDSTPTLNKQSFSHNIKYKQDNYLIMNNDANDTNRNNVINNPNKVSTYSHKNNKHPISYYLNSYNYNHHKQRKTCDVNKTLTNTLLDINQNYDDFNVKNHHFLKASFVPSIPTPLVVKKEKIHIKVTLNTIADLIKLADDYPLSPNVEYNIDMEAIHFIRPDVVRLNDMIGMHNLKENILDQMLYFIQKLHIHKNQNVNNEFMHTVIYGPPGTGKTETAHIIGGIYSKLGILKNNVFKKVTRADLIAGYLGQTAIKTTEVVKSAIGGVLFIDEAYALGNTEKKDSFAKECIDTLCESLSNHKHELMVIIAGYEEDLKKCFFSYNQGLDSRFIWRFKIDDYTPEELQLIFNKKVKECGWTIDNISSSWFKKHNNYFKYFGRDMETLLSKVKIAHSRRVFCLSEDKKRHITLKDVKKGFKLYLKNEEVKSRVENKDNPLVNMYL